MSNKNGMSKNEDEGFLQTVKKGTNETNGRLKPQNARIFKYI